MSLQSLSLCIIITLAATCMAAIAEESVPVAAPPVNAAPATEAPIDLDPAPGDGVPTVLPPVQPGELTPAPVITPAPVKAKKVAGPVKKKRRKPVSRAVFDKSKTLIRFLRDTRDFGQISTASTFPIPANFSFYVATHLKSTQGTSRSEIDMDKFSTTIYMYSPHVYNFGIVGMNADSSGGKNASARVGLYHKFVYKKQDIAIGLIPMLFPITENQNRGRLNMLYSVDFYNRFGFSGHFSYVTENKEAVLATAPILYLEVTKGTRLLGIYDYNSSAKPKKAGWQFGVQFQF